MAAAQHEHADDHRDQGAVAHRVAGVDEHAERAVRVAGGDQRRRERAGHRRGTEERRQAVQQDAAAHRRGTAAHGARVVPHQHQQAQRHQRVQAEKADVGHRRERFGILMRDVAGEDHIADGERPDPGRDQPTPRPVGRVPHPAQEHRERGKEPGDVVEHLVAQKAGPRPFGCEEHDDVGAQHHRLRTEQTPDHACPGHGTPPRRRTTVRRRNCRNPGFQRPANPGIGSGASRLGCVPAQSIGSLRSLRPP